MIVNVDFVVSKDTVWSLGGPGGAGGGAPLAAFLIVFVCFSWSCTSSPFDWRHVYVELMHEKREQIGRKSVLKE